MRVDLEQALRQLIRQEVEDEVGRKLALLKAEQPPVASPYLTVGEAACYLRCSRQRVYDLLSSGRLRRYKDGSRVLIAREDLERYLAGEGSTRRR